MKKADVFTRVALFQNKMVVSGEAGSSLLNQIVNLNDLNPPARK
jgi:hypothetical protein